MTPNQEHGVVPERRGGGFSLGFFVSAIFFFFSILASVGMFVYIKMIEGSIDEKTAQAQELLKEVGSENISMLERLDVRMKEADRLLTEHRAVSGLLATLEAATIRDVRYTSLAFTESAGGGTEHSVSLTGESRTFGHVATQTDKFVEAGSLLRAPVVTTLERGNGIVNFNVDMRAAPELVRFGQVLERDLYTQKTTPSTPAPAAASTPAPVIQFATDVLATSTATTTAPEE